MEPVSLTPVLLVLALLTVLVFQCAVFQCAASDSDSQKAVWVDRTAYSPGETVLVSVNGTFFNGSNLTAYIISPSSSLTGLALISSEAGYTAEYSQQQDIVLGTYTVVVSGENVTEIAEFDIRMLSVDLSLKPRYPAGNVYISGNVTDTATGNPVNASVHLTLEGQTLSTDAVEGFFSTDFPAVSPGQKSLTITAIDSENISTTVVAGFEVYAPSPEGLELNASKESASLSDPGDLPVVFASGADSEGPVISSVSDTPDPVERGGPVSITADVTDNVEVGPVFVRINGTDYPMALSEVWMGRTGLFFEGFESGSLATNNWTVSGTGAPWDIESTSPNSYEGSFNALTSDAGIKIIEAGIDTAGYENLNLSLYYRLAGLSGSEYFAIEWYDGTQWNGIYNVTEHTNKYTYFYSTLPAEASDNSDFKLRFRCSMGSKDTARLDNIELTGTGITSEPYGYVYNTSALPPGGHSYTVYARDSSGNEASPLAGSFTVVDGIPGISSVSDSPDPVEQGENITISVNTADGFEVNDVRLNIEGTNYTVAEGVNTETELFFDGFESGSLETFSWITSGVYPWFIDSNSHHAYEGDYSVMVVGTLGPGDGGASILKTGLDTTGYNKVDLSFRYKLAGITGAGEYFSVDLYEGTQWNAFFNTTGNGNSYLFFDSSLPAASGDNPDFKFRFNCYSTDSSDSVRIDNVEVTGKRAVSGPFQYSFNTSSLSPGVYDYTVYANDTSGQEAIPVSGNFTVVEAGSQGQDPNSTDGNESHTPDFMIPVINSISDAPDPAARGGNISITANVTDNVEVCSVWVEIYGTCYIMSRLQADSDLYEYSFDSSVLLPGTYNYNVSANDSSGNPADPLSGNFTLVNSPPVLSPIGPKTVNESETLTVTLFATDPNGDPVTYGTNATLGTLAGNSFTWTPGFAASGVYYVEFTASDGEMTDSETVAITVNESYVNFSAGKRVEKGAAPDSYSVTLTLTSHVDFNGTGLRVYDLIPENFTLAYPAPDCSGVQGRVCYWSLDLAPGESRTVTYTLEGTGKYSLGDAFVVGVDPQ